MSSPSFARLVKGVARAYPLVLFALVACDSSESPSEPVNQTPGAISITTATVGVDFPTALNGQVGTSAAVPLQLNGTRTIGQLRPGTYLVTLYLLPDNCRNQQGPLSVTVTSGATTPVRFDIQCTATSGALRLSVSTSGPDPDQSGYRVQLGTVRTFFVGANTSFVFTGLPGGSQTTTLSEIASNCSIIGSPSQTVTISVGGLKRDTATASFSLACTAVEKFAFRRNNAASNVIEVAYLDGSELVAVESGFDPAWSPDGKTLAFGWLECGYYYSPCVRRGLITFEIDGQFLILTGDSTDSNPAWRPTDGALIVFGRRGALYTIRPVVSAPPPVPLSLPANVRRALQPAWSPDATRIAFTCEMDNGWFDICLIAPDGTSFVRLTNDASKDEYPDWSPDGRTIAFSTTDAASASQVALISTNGGAITYLLPGRNPAWSRDGTRILFEGTSTLGIFRFTLATGSTIQLTTSNDHDPAWRP